MIYFTHRFHKSSSKVCSKENQQFEDFYVTLRIEEFFLLALHAQLRDQKGLAISRSSPA